MGIGDREYMRGGSRFAFLASGAIPPIIAANTLVFLAWHLGSERFMQENFLVSLAHMQSGRYWTLLTAAFSHTQLVHFLLNMLVLYGFGRTLEERWGTRRFLAFYLAAAVVSSAAHPLATWLGWPPTFALGASGAISGLILCFAFYYPKATILFMLVLPMPAWLLVAIGSAFDLWGLIEQRSGGGGRIGHAVHLAGALCGVVYVLLIERGRVSMPRRRPRGRILRPEESPWQVSERLDRPDPDDRRLDELLEKVSRGGLDSLSITEREDLERISARRRQSRR